MKSPVGCGPLLLPLVAVSFVLAVATSCASGPTAEELARDRMLLEQEERRLMQPFQTPQTIFVTDLELKLSANLFQKLTIGVIGNAHELSHTRVNNVETKSYRQRIPGGPRMQLHLGGTKFEVENRMDLVIYGTGHAPTLSARGENVSRQVGSQSSHMRSIEIRNGSFQPSR